MPLDGSPNCSLCPAASQCIGLVQSHVSLAEAGRMLFTANDPATAIYVVRAGCAKSVTIDDEGNERVRGFHLPGDLIGLDALGADRYPASAIAVSQAQVCRVPKSAVMQKIAESPALARLLLERMSRDLAQAQALAGDYNADQRVAAFLLNMQERLRPMPGAPARLPMGRGDIANHLRLATETVCRVLARFTAKGLIQSDDRKIRLLKTAPLQALAAPVGITHPQLLAA